MFTLPQIISVPVLSGLGSGTVVFPTVGMVVAWFMIAALVGAGLGILRQATYRRSDTARPEEIPRRPLSLQADHAHQAAA